MVSLLEMFYVASLGQQVTWPCKPDQVGWLWTVINFLIFSFVLYNQLMCYLNILRDLQYHSYASFSWKWGLYSWPIAIAIAVICSFFYEPGLIFVGVLFLIAQLVQLGIIFRRVIPKGGWMYAFLCATVYLVGSVAIAAVFLHFLMILLLVAAAIFVLAVLGNGEHSGSAVFNPREKEPERCPYCHCTIGFCSCEVHMARFHEEIWKNYH